MNLVLFRGEIPLYVRNDILIVILYYSDYLRLLCSIFHFSLTSFVIQSVER